VPLQYPVVDIIKINETVVRFGASAGPALTDRTDQARNAKSAGHYDPHNKHSRRDQLRSHNGNNQTRRNQYLAPDQNTTGSAVGASQE